MESGLRGIFLNVSGLLLGFSLLTPACAQEEVEQVIQPQLERREIKPPKISSDDFEITAFGGMMSVEDFGTSGVYGARVAYHLTEGFFFEAAYGMTRAGETSYESLSGSARLLTSGERDLSYYNLSIGYDFLPGETFIRRKYAFNTALYFAGGVGSTDFAGDERFTLNAGFGYRMLATRWLSLHLDVRDHIFDTDILGKDKTTHNLELTGGIAVYF